MADPRFPAEPQPDTSARQRLLDAASRLFYAEGIQATGVDRVVASAGIAKATLYAHFRGKDDLITAYLARRSEEWRAHVDAELPHRASDALGQVLAVFDVLGDWFAEPDYRGCPFINAEAEHQLTPVARAVTTAHRQWVRDLFAGLLAEGGHSQPDVTAHQLQALYDGAMVMAAFEHDPGAARITRSAAAALIGR